MNNCIRSDKANRDQEERIRIDKDKTSRELWTQVKKKAGWFESLSPVSLLGELGKAESNPKVM